MNIAFVTPVNFRCRDVESILLKALAEGHQPHLILFNEKGRMGESVEKKGVKVHAVTFADSKWKILNQVIYIIKFCRRNKVAVLLSHLEPTNFVSILAQYFIKSKVLIYRHHVDLAQLSGFGNSWAYGFTYSRAKNIIAVSAAARKHMIEHEGVQPEKINHIDLSYDFNQYDQPDSLKISKIRKGLSDNNHIVLMTVGRLDEFKRPWVALETLRILVHEKNISAKLVFLGQGPLRDSIEKSAIDQGLFEFVKFEGFVENSMDFLAAADFLVHPSISEASSVVVKEAALLEIPVIVVKDVGDFSEYIHPMENGFPVNRETFAAEAADIIVKYSGDKELRTAMARKLKVYIRERFSIENGWQKLISLMR